MQWLWGFIHISSVAKSHSSLLYIKAPLASLQLNTKTWILFLEKDQKQKYEATGYKIPNPCWDESPHFKVTDVAKWQNPQRNPYNPRQDTWRENIWFHSNKHYLPTDLGLIAQLWIHLSHWGIPSTSWQITNRTPISWWL